MASISGGTVTLDRTITLLAGQAYTFGVMSLDYTEILEYSVTSIAGEHSTITLNSAPPTGDYSNHEFFCFSSGHGNLQYITITSISEPEKGQRLISGIEYYPQKYSDLALGIVSEVPSSTLGLSATLPAVTNITFSQVIVKNAAFATIGH